MAPQLRTKWHKPAFAELGLPNHQQLTLLVYILMAEARNLANPQPETVHQPEDERIHLVPMKGAGVVRQLRRYFQDALYLLRLKEKGEEPGASGPRACPYWGMGGSSLTDKPGEKAAKHPQ